MRRLHLYHASSPVDGWLPYFTGRWQLRHGAVWLIEWRRGWLWWA